MGGTVELAVATLHGEDETMAAFDCVIIVSTPNEAPGSSILVHERSLASAWHVVGASTAEETASCARAGRAGDVSGAKRALMAALSRATRPLAHSEAARGVLVRDFSRTSFTWSSSAIIITEGELFTARSEGAPPP